MADYSVIDAVCNIWTPEALSHRPGWTDEFFVGKVKGKHDSAGITLETMIEGMDEAGIDVAFLVAAKAGRVGLPGCYHMPLEVVSRAVEQHPDRFRGMLGLDPYMGMDGVRQLETAVKDFGFVGAHLYPHWFELPPNNAKARHNLIVALGIHRRLHQHDALVPLLVIVSDLQQGCALAAVHGAVRGKNFAHVLTSANWVVALKCRLQSG